MSRALWLLFLGSGHRSHYATSRFALRTVCGRSTRTASEWCPPGGGEAGCEICYRKGGA